MALAQASRPGDADEICPVCKSSRYLNPRMRFLINPECYHRMCESCVDRIFSQGPAPCPIAGCGRTLRKARFRKQTFDDLKVERECDLRARIERILNRREEEFTDLRAYNDYLEFKEDITFNLIEQKDVAATEVKLDAYRLENQSSIRKNAGIANQEHSSLEEREAAQREISRLSRESARKEEDEKKLAKEASRREFTQLVAEGRAGPEDVLRGGLRVVLKKSTARRTAVEKVRQQQLHDLVQAQSKDSFGTISANGNADLSYTIRGLKAPVVVEEKPYDPFGGLSVDTMYYTLQNHYDYPWLDNARKDSQITAGGYDVLEYYSRALMESNAGLCCFIADEKAMLGSLSDDAILGTAGATVVARQAGNIDMGDDNA